MIPLSYLVAERQARRIADRPPLAEAIALADRVHQLAEARSVPVAPLTRSPHIRDGWAELLQHPAIVAHRAVTR